MKTKTKKLTLTTRYFGRKLNIRMDANLADRLMAKEGPADYIVIDLNRYCAGYGMFYLTESQARKILGFNTDNDYFDKIEFAE